jgi:N4-gp56 family major capsid protein
MSPNVLEGMATILQTNNFMRINFKGFDGYLAVLHPYQVAHFRKNKDWFNAYITAGPRDEKGNSIFAGVNGKGEVGCWANFYIMQSNKIPTSAHAARYSEVPINGANEANVRRAIFMGANAMFYAEADRPHFVMEKVDYGNREGVAIVSNWGATRSDYTEDSASATLLAQTVAVCSTYSPASTV